MQLALHVLGNPEDAEDLCQGVCIQCLLGQAYLREEASFRRWLYRILKNDCQDYLRRRKRRPELTEAEVEERVFQTAHERTALEQATLAGQQAALQDIVEAALKLLPERQRQLLIWRHLEECSYGEIARRSGMKESSIDNSLRRARAAFRKVHERLMKEGIG